MELLSNSLKEGQRVKDCNAFGVIDAESHVALSNNLNPHLQWSDVPDGVKSYAVICHDPDVPSRGDDVNQEGREVPEDLPRVDFFHWLLWNLPAGVRDISEGSHSSGVTPRGKQGPAAAGGAQHGKNDFTSWFAGDEEMSGDYYGYDGPCPPWNDALIHRYIFTVYALDVERLDVGSELNGAALRKAMKGHVLDQAAITTTYTLNPRLVL